MEVREMTSSSRQRGDRIFHLTGIPSQLTEEETEKLLRMETSSTSDRDAERAISRVSRHPPTVGLKTAPALRLVHLLGPSGVGNGALETLAEFLFARGR